MFNKPGRMLQAFAVLVIATGSAWAAEEPGEHPSREQTGGDGVKKTLAQRLGWVRPPTAEPLDELTTPPEPGAAKEVEPASMETTVGTWNPLASAQGENPYLGTWMDEGLLMQGLERAGLATYLEEWRIQARGWLEQSFTWNPDSPDDRFNLPVAFNDRSNEYQMNQLYLVLERVIDRDGGYLDFGARCDLLYGTDYYFVESIRLETHRNGTQRWNSDDGPRPSRGFFVGGVGMYGLAMPQLYGEIFVPIYNGLVLRGGHFYTTLGSESAMAPENFFFSHSYLKQYGEPYTHTGTLAIYPLTDTITIHGGFTRGWDSFGDLNGTEAILAGVRWKSHDERTMFGFGMHVGKELEVLTDNRRKVFSFVVSHEFFDAFRYTIQSDFAKERDGSSDAMGEPEDAEWYGVLQSLVYEINESLSVGARFEWFRDDDLARVFAIGGFAEGGDYYEATFGLNWRPCPSVVVRPEARWDWSNTDLRSIGSLGVYDDLSDKNQFTLGVDVIWSF